ncbi:YgaC family protein, partial [Escherichia coli]|nr:YgaC family protein [Escherichia coli]
SHRALSEHKTLSISWSHYPTLKERSSTLAEPASDIKTCDHYQQFPLYLAGERHEHYGIPHGFSSRVALERYLNGLFGEAS